MPDCLHGFRPGKAIGTAWHEILTKVIAAKNIYEFYLRKLFERVSNSHITDRLLSLGVPKSIAYMFQDLHRSKPQLPIKHEIDETSVLEKRDRQLAIRTGQHIKDHAALR